MQANKKQVILLGYAPSINFTVLSGGINNLSILNAATIFYLNILIKQ